METLRKQGKMVIHGLGTFVASSRAERKGINPATKEPMIIPACVVPGFRAAAALKLLLNEESQPLE